MFRVSNDRGPKCLLYISCISFIIPRHHTCTFRRAGDGVFHSNLISMSKGMARP